MTDTNPSASSRRDFIKSSTAAAAGASAFASLALPRGAFAGNDDTIQIALVGAGGRGTGAANHADFAWTACSRRPVTLVVILT